MQRYRGLVLIIILLTFACMHTEQWKPIQGFEGRYQVSSFGNVKGLDRTSLMVRKGDKESHQRIVKGAIIRGNEHKLGYWKVCLCNGKRGNKVTATVHSLVWNSFKGKPSNGLFIDHIDGNKKNNRLDNLRLVTALQNVNYHYINTNNRGSVTKRGERFEASIWYKRKNIYLGLHDTKETAKGVVNDFINNTIVKELKLQV